MWSGEMTRASVPWRIGWALLLAALVAAASVPCAPGRSSGGSPLDGRWRWTWTREELHRAGASLFYIGANMTEFRDGRIYSLDPKTGDTQGFRGTYTVLGDVATLVFRRGVAGTVAGIRYVMRFTVFHDRLTWSKIPGRAALDALPIVPWTRVD
jgi:hypothetical protein